MNNMDVALLSWATHYGLDSEAALSRTNAIRFARTPRDVGEAASQPAAWCRPAARDRPDRQRADCRSQR
jgi:hypothetical protein